MLAASLATACSVCGPLARTVVSHENEYGVAESLTKKTPSTYRSTLTTPTLSSAVTSTTDGVGDSGALERRRHGDGRGDRVRRRRVACRGADRCQGVDATPAEALVVATAAVDGRRFEQLRHQRRRQRGIRGEHQSGDAGNDRAGERRARDGAVQTEALRREDVVAGRRQVDERPDAGKTGQTVGFIRGRDRQDERILRRRVDAAAVAGGRHHQRAVVDRVLGRGADRGIAGDAVETQVDDAGAVIGGPDDAVGERRRGRTAGGVRDPHRHDRRGRRHTGNALRRCWSMRRPHRRPRCRDRTGRRCWCCCCRCCSPATSLPANSGCAASMPLSRIAITTPGAPCVVSHAAGARICGRCHWLTYCGSLGEKAGSNTKFFSTNLISGRRSMRRWIASSNGAGTRMRTTRVLCPMSSTKAAP